MARKPATSSDPSPATRSSATTSSANLSSSPLQQQQQQKQQQQRISSRPPSISLSSQASAKDAAIGVWNDYLDNTPQRTFLLDAFLAYLVAVGGVQFVYAVVFGNYVCTHHRASGFPLFVQFVTFLSELETRTSSLLLMVHDNPVVDHDYNFMHWLIANIFILRQPFNAFLSGFCAAVGQFVLLVSLRIQIVEKPPVATSNTNSFYTNKKVPGAPTQRDATTSKEGETGDPQEASSSPPISSERAFAEFLFGSLVLHAFCVNFIN